MWTEGSGAAAVLGFLQLHKGVPFYIFHSQFFSFILVSFSLFESESRSVVSNSLRPHELWNSSGQNTRVGSLSLLQGVFPTQGSNPGLLHCWRILPAESQGKLKNTGVGSLSLFQWIFPTQESNQGLLRCRQILYQLSYQGSPCHCLIHHKIVLLCFTYM